MEKRSLVDDDILDEPADGKDVKPGLSVGYATSLPVHKDRNSFYPIDGYAYLNVQVTKAGSRSWVLRYRIAKKQKIYTIGPIPGVTAKQVKNTLYPQLIAMISNGIDPNEDKRKKKLEKENPTSVSGETKLTTVKDLAIRFLDEFVSKNNKKSTRMEKERMIKLYILNKTYDSLNEEKTNFKDMIVDFLTTKIISKVVHDIEETPRQANIFRSLIGKMISWGIEFDDGVNITVNPMVGVSVIPTNPPREKRLYEADIQKLGNALNGTKENIIAVNAILLILLTGMRKSELIGNSARGIVGLTWDRVKFDECTVEVFTKRRKTVDKQTRLVFLGENAVSLLKNMPRMGDNNFVIPGKLDDSSLVGLQKIWERLRCDAGLAIHGNPKDEDPGIHDLRRTFASVGLDLGLHSYIPELLGHGTKSVTDGYTWAEKQGLISAANKIGNKINYLLNVGNGACEWCI